MKAFELDPDSIKACTGATVDRFAKKYGLSIQGAQAKIDSISKIGQDVGLDFHYAETRYTTFDAHRLTKLAQKTNKALADHLSERLYKAYFSEGLGLADHFVLLRIARDEGLDENEVRSLLATDEFDWMSEWMNGKLHATTFMVCLTSFWMGNLPFLARYL